MSTPRPTEPLFACLCCVGPDPRELPRLCDLFDSLTHYEPGPGVMVLIDDHPTPRDLASLLPARPHWQIVALQHLKHAHAPRSGVGAARFGKGIAAAVLQGLDHITSQTRADVVLKVDTDSLVIGPCASRLRERFAREPGIGMLGASTHTPEGEPRDISRAAEAIRCAGRPSVRWRHPRDALRRWFAPGPRVVRDLLRRARRFGYVPGEHCLGGGYAISRAALDAAAPDWRGCAAWVALDVSEDAAASLVVRASGLSLGSCVGAGEVFGVRYIGLPFDLDTLARSDYAVIHAVKNDPRFSEDDVRAFFRQIRARGA